MIYSIEINVSVCLSAYFISCIPFLLPSKRQMSIHLLAVNKEKLIFTKLENVNFT
jgi:hypothetical protein